MVISNRWCLWRKGTNFSI